LGPGRSGGVPDSKDGEPEAHGKVGPGARRAASSDHLPDRFPGVRTAIRVASTYHTSGVLGGFRLGRWACRPAAALRRMV